MFKRILVPVDGSRTSEEGLRTALKLAKTSRASVFVLHVVEENVVLLGGDYTSGAYLDQLVKELKESGKQVLARSKTLARRQGVRTQTVLIEDLGSRRVADLIVQQARKLRADVIILGTHGRRGLRRVVMGSDAEEVVRIAPAPVLLVRPSKRRST
jgi:nucleotide-binding universal stress UspA family protein